MKIKIITILIIFLFFPIISAFDNETIGICGGDEETLILCVGDLENSPIGENVYTAPSVAGRTGGSGTEGSGARFDSEVICNNIKKFFLENLSEEKLFESINNQSKIFISKGTIDKYIEDFEGMCNMTIEKKEEGIIKKAVFPFTLILILALLISSYCYREKIKKWILLLFDDDEEDSINDLKRD